jgi:hypothetical protein
MPVPLKNSLVEKHVANLPLPVAKNIDKGLV